MSLAKFSQEYLSLYSQARLSSSFVRDLLHLLGRLVVEVGSSILRLQEVDPGLVALAEEVAAVVLFMIRMEYKITMTLSFRIRVQIIDPYIHISQNSENDAFSIIINYR